MDSRAIDIFINNGMYLFQDTEVAFDASFECYKYGHNIVITGSNHGPLQSLATSNNRDVVPAFSAFRRYFEGDDDYADSLLVRHNFQVNRPPFVLYFASLQLSIVRCSL